ncbi:MAG: hypothetical protein JO180_02880 [Gemmatirosa sp.]|nr:hypothetical protein [Gemmatirosa sp.]
MAEIEFKRRGTPLWVVVVALLVVAGLVWALIGRGKGAAPVPADTAATSAAPGAATPVAPPPVNSAAAAPASATGPVAKFVAWVDTSKPPTEAAAERAEYASGIRLLADALQERVPMAGAQIVLARAMADSLALPGATQSQAINALQAAFFAVSYAMRGTPPGARMNDVASNLQLTKSIGAQREDIGKFFVTARNAMYDPSQKQPSQNEPAAPPTGAPAKP